MQNIVLHMMNFQHVHKIRGARNTNTKCMYDILKTDSNKTIKSSEETVCKTLDGPGETVCKTLEVLPAIVTSYNNDDATQSSVVVSLVILVTEGEEKVLLDPCYDVFSLENKRYYLNIKEFVDAVAESEQNRDKLKTLAMDFLLLMETAKQIGDGSFDQHNRELYEKQMEYVKLKEQLS
jgi:hypothetical protein